MSETYKLVVPIPLPTFSTSPHVPPTVQIQTEHLPSLRIRAPPYLQEVFRRNTVLDEFVKRLRELKVFVDTPAASPLFLLDDDSNNNDSDPSSSSSDPSSSSSSSIDPSSSPLNNMFFAVLMTALNSISDPAALESVLDQLIATLNANKVFEVFQDSAFRDDSAKESRPSRTKSEMAKIGKLVNWLTTLTSSASSPAQPPTIYNTALTTLVTISSSTGMLSHVLPALKAFAINPISTPSPEIISATEKLASVVEQQKVKIGAMVGVWGDNKKWNKKSHQSRIEVENARSHSLLHNTSFDKLEKSPATTLSPTSLSTTSTTSAHTHTYLNRGFSSGRWSWTFAITSDVHSDESVCLGAGIKPLQSSSYNSSKEMWMYRCYNGNLYERGGQVRGVSKEKVHPGNQVSERSERALRKTTIQ